MPEIKVTELNYYPIKSCGAITAPEVTFTELGIEHDREWMLVSRDKEHNRFNCLSQRTHPTLADVQTRIEDEGLVVEAPGMGELTVPLEQDRLGDVIKVKLSTESGTGTDVGRDAEEYFSDYLGQKARLIQVRQPRKIKPPGYSIEETSKFTRFANSFPILLTSNFSLDALNSLLRSRSQAPMSRFRPNIVVEGAPPYDEDYWQTLCIGNLSAYVVRACIRGPMPGISKSVTEKLHRTRRGTDPVNDNIGEFFGQYLIHIFEPGVTVKVGDAVEVMKRSDSRNFY